MNDKHAALLPDQYYHIYNRANGNEKLFLHDENYAFFLRQYKIYISSFSKTTAYCLMPNHFHFLIQINDEELLKSTFPKFGTLEKYEQANLLSKRFSNLFSSYTQAFNKQQGRKGSLFIKNFKKKHIDDSSYFTRLIQYIHLNPVDAGIVSLAENWKYSSYAAIIGSKKTQVERTQVLEWFDGLDNFKDIHRQCTKLQFDDLGF
ncbi:MAG: hypothetical protein NWS53_01665 [Salibacteraceae bacterium]|nr:hypothetical protein [Salibacteraceae bacterium]